jgi:hypothetical protein
VKDNHRRDPDQRAFAEDYLDALLVVFSIHILSSSDVNELQLISLAPFCRYGGELNGGASRAIAAPIHRLFAGRTNYICHWPAGRRTQIA